MAVLRVCLFVCNVVAVVKCATTPYAGSKPNFVVLFVDDMGIDQIAVPKPNNVYGYSGNNGTIETPNLAKLTREGMLFQTWYSSFHVCSPSRASMMTGRYSIRSGVGIPNSIYAPHAPGPNSGGNLVFTAESIGGLPLNETTTAEALKSAGYATMMLGKWHLGQRDIYLPTARGFDEYLGIPFSQDMGLSFWSTHGWKPSPPYFPTPLPLLNGTSVIEQPTGLHTLVKKYADAAVEFIHRQTASSTPYYLYVPFNHVHGPNSCGADFCGKSSRGPIGDAVEEMDWAVGQIMDAIQSSDGAKNTLVFFTSDNGAPQRPDGNAPLRGYKGQTWEGGFREPGIAWWPGHIQAGAVSQAIVATFDVHPTLLKLGGVSATHQEQVIMDGQDLSNILFADYANQGPGSEPTAGHDCYFFYAYAVAADADNALSAVRCGDYKAYYFIHGDAPPAPYKPGKQAKPILFNLAMDPSESHPVDQESAEYQKAIATISKGKATHLATISPVPNQNGRGSGREYAICSDPDSQKKLPKWPNCTSTPENWIPASVCSSQACLKANSGFKKSCAGPQTEEYDENSMIV